MTPIGPRLCTLFSSTIIAACTLGEQTAQTGKGAFPGRAFEVLLEPDDRPQPYLFCFHQPHRFFAMDQKRICVHAEDVSLQQTGQRFIVTLPTQPGWMIAGSFDGPKVTGEWRNSGALKPRRFHGSEVDYAAYRFPVGPSEVIVAMRCTDAKGRISFDILAPHEFRGRHFIAFDDGGPFDPRFRALLAVGHTYLWRVERGGLTDDPLAIPVARLANMVEADPTRLDPRYRPAAHILGEIASPQPRKQ